MGIHRTIRWDGVQSRRALVGVLFAIAGLAAPAWAESTGTTHVEGTKEVTWSFFARPGPPESKIDGSWSARAWTFARCAHDEKGEFESKGAGVFNGMQGFAGAKLTAPQAKVPHALADAWVQISAGKAVGVGVPDAQGIQRMNVTIEKKWDESPAAAFDPQGSSFARAGASGRASVAVSGTTKYELTGKVNGVEIKPRTGEGTGAGAGRGAKGQRGRVHDPVSITVINERTNQMITEPIFRFDIDGTFNNDGAGWRLNGTQLVLSGGADADGNWTSSVVMDGDASSSWLVNPLGSFGVSLSGGVFGATGYWANAWQLTTDGLGHTLTASIDLALLGWDLQYVVPESVLNAGTFGKPAYEEDTFTHMITSEFWSEAEAPNIPTPGAISLLGAGVMVLATAWRRRGRIV